MADDERTVTLAAFGGAAPAGLARDLESLNGLPASAQDDLWQVLQHNLSAKLGPGVETYVEQFCAAHGLVVDALVPVVRAVRQLFREAATRDVAPAEVTRDLNLLCGTHPAIVKRVSAWYERALPFIRTMAVFDALGDFGAVLDDVRVRTAYVPVSQHHPDKLLPVLTLAVSYRDERTGPPKQMTWQLSPQAVERLKSVCAALK